MRTFLALAAVASVVCVTACGGSSDDGSGGSGAATTAGSGGPGAGGAGGAGAGGDGGAVPTELVHRGGRFDDADPTGGWFSWPGTSLATRVDGAGVGITLAGAADVYFEIVVDGASVGRFATTGGQGSYPLASALSAGPHDVAIVRRDEGFFGDVQFLGFEPAAGASLVASPWPYAHRLEFVGDSITCGYGVEGADAFCSFSGDTESAYLSYASVAARTLSAAAHLIAYSGKGVYQNYGGDLTEPMGELYGRTLTNDPASVWDFARFAPDAVVVNLGTNDFSATIAQADFVAAYVALLTDVRAHHPAVPIFCVSWPSWGATHAAWVATAIAAFAQADVHEVAFTVDDADGWGCDYHPGQLMQQKLGATLATAISTTLGW